MDEKLNLEANATLDKGTHMVWIFAEDQVNVEAGSDVAANLFTQAKLKIDPATATNLTTLTGLFIADKVDAGAFVHWNWDAAQCPFTPPVSLTKGTPIFTAQLHETPDNLQVDLNWITSTNAEDEQYEVEKSADGQAFQSVLTANADNQDRLPKFYSGLDASPQEGNWWYRLKTTYLDGSTTWSEPKQVRIELPEAYTLFPNPARQRVQVSLKTAAGQPALLQLVNGQGEVVQEQNFERLPVEPVSFDLSQIEAGIYLLNVQVEGKRSRALRFVAAK